MDYLLGITGENMIEWRDYKFNVALLVYNLIFIKNFHRLNFN